MDSQNNLDCPFDFTSRCTMSRCDCKPKENKKVYFKENNNKKGKRFG